MKIAFLIGSPAISGGTYVILQHALYLRSRGHDVTIVTVYTFQKNDLKWHNAYRSLPIYFKDEIKKEYEFDLVIATWWLTAEQIHTLNGKFYIYFVQSIESRFYPNDEIALRQRVERTYQLGLPVITEATWISKYLSEKYGVSCFLARNGIRKDIYSELGDSYENPSKLRVLIEGPLGVPFKNVEQTIKVVRRSKADSVWLLTSSDVKTVEGVDRVFSRQPISEVAKIYRSCDVLVKLSYVEGMFGPPLEMFHCGGTAIVYEVTGYDEYIVNGYNAIAVPVDKEALVVRALNNLMEDRSELNRLKQGARITAEKWIDWEESSRVFAEGIRVLMKRDEPSRTYLQEKNEESLKMYFAQSTISGSKILLSPKLLSLMFRVYQRLPQPLRVLAKRLKPLFIKG